MEVALLRLYNVDFKALKGFVLWFRNGFHKLLEVEFADVAPRF